MYTIITIGCFVGYAITVGVARGWLFHKHDLALVVQTHAPPVRGVSEVTGFSEETPDGTLQRYSPYSDGIPARSVTR